MIIREVTENAEFCLCHLEPSSSISSELSPIALRCFKDKALYKYCYYYQCSFYKPNMTPYSHDMIILIIIYNNYRGNSNNNYRSNSHLQPVVQILLPTTNNEKIFLQYFLVILKRTLQNY